MAKERICFRSSGWDWGRQRGRAVFAFAFRCFLKQALGRAFVECNLHAVLSSCFFSVSWAIDEREGKWQEQEQGNLCSLLFGAIRTVLYEDRNCSLDDILSTAGWMERCSLFHLEHRRNGSIASAFTCPVPFYIVVNLAAGREIMPQQIFWKGKYICKHIHWICVSVSLIHSETCEFIWIWPRSNQWKFCHQLVAGSRFHFCSA